MWSAFHTFACVSEAEVDRALASENDYMWIRHLQAESLSAAQERADLDMLSALMDAQEVEDEAEAANMQWEFVFDDILESVFGNGSTCVIG